MKKLRVNIFFSIIIFLLNLYSNSIANISSNFINDITTRASNILSSQDTEEFKIQELIKIGENSVDIDGIGFYTLGKHRKSLSDDQKVEFKRFLENISLKVFQQDWLSIKKQKLL